MLSSYDSPDLVMVYHDDHDGKFAPPEGFDLVSPILSRMLRI